VATPEPFVCRKHWKQIDPAPVVSFRGFPRGAATPPMLPCGLLFASGHFRFSSGGVKAILCERTMSHPQSGDLPPRAGSRGEPRLPSRSTRPRLLRTLVMRLARSARNFEWHSSNEFQSVDCAAQHDRWVRANPQFRVNWKPRHVCITPRLRPRFRPQKQAETARRLDSSISGRSFDRPLDRSTATAAT
jgi:hypothetical protein